MAGAGIRWTQAAIYGYGSGHKSSELAMPSYSVAEAKNRLPSLIDKALEGEEVVITRHGKPVAELRGCARRREPAPSKGLYEWLRARREARKPVGITSVELLNQMYEDDEQ
jgi:prevent-host-death family protein